MSLAADLDDFIRLCTSGKTLEAIERFYADDVVVFENHELARAGLAKCLAFERQSLAAQPEPATVVCKGRACDEASGVAYVTWQVRYRQGDTPMRLDEVAMQRWSRGRIVEERFFYEGVVDESDPAAGGEPPC